ncbi:hypothetical protein [Leucobacter triazinivorans]|uniref:Uncharacterized protein n=1 Tax=Leucobacter triazinivorans TaxID=1784719 RepID=A0A4P6KHU9_9MICO|nr:hypothetical protein [Leucobacter triazinivorans]QBE49942.1 hypothetical protein EVS81_14800 [Leucobacter triazinivorans]
MTATVSLADHATRDDLRIFLERLQRAGQEDVRLVTRGAVLAVYGCTQAPRGITDTSPVVLVMRAFALGVAPVDAVDETVPSRSLLDRIARLGIVGLALDIPDTSGLAAWAGVLPPVSGWTAAGRIDARSLATVAAEGIERVSAALPENPGEAVVQRVRASVWGAEIAPGVPAAAAFAAETMGLLRDEDPVSVARSLTWTRLSTARGHVLVRSLLGEGALPAGSEILG